MTQTAVAHIITPDAKNLGAPKVIITTRPNANGDTDQIDLIDLSAWAFIYDAYSALGRRGWVVDGDMAQIEYGHNIVDIKRA